MRFWFARALGAIVVLLLLTEESPAPLVYTPGEGWHYEPVGGARWRRMTAKEQLDVAQTAFDKQEYSLALKAARRTVNQWPFSDYEAQGQYLMGRCYEAKRKDEKAFKAYQKLLDQHPKTENFDEVIQRQFQIANRFLNGQWFRLWGIVPVPPSMDKTIKLYEQIVKNGSYSDVAPTAQMNIGAAYERKRFVKNYPAAAKAYERAADRYSDQPAGVDALYKVGLAYTKQAKRAEYDQSIAAQAITTFTDFMTLHPEHARVGEAQRMIDSLKTEQARGSFDIAKFYEKNRRWQGALIYYNEVLLKDPDSRYADAARQRIDAIKKRVPN